MGILQMLYEEDRSALTDMQLNELKKNIRKGAEDLSQDWANALELVHRAYLVSKIQRPTPDLFAGWKQYESMIKYAVEQLSRARGIKGNWRMSTGDLTHALHNYRVRTENKEFIIPGDSLDNAIKKISKPLIDKNYDITPKQIDENTTQIVVSKWGIIQKIKILISQEK